LKDVSRYNLNNSINNGHNNNYNNNNNNNTRPKSPTVQSPPMSPINRHNLPNSPKSPKRKFNIQNNNQLKQQQQQQQQQSQIKSSLFNNQNELILNVSKFNYNNLSINVLVKVKKLSYQLYLIMSNTKSLKLITKSLNIIIFANPSNLKSNLIWPYAFFKTFSIFVVNQ
jgi:hypothetical protein